MVFRASTDDSIESLKKKLVEVCEMTREERKKLGNLGRNFVLMEKNSTIQVRKICEMIDFVLRGRKVNDR